MVENYDEYHKHLVMAAITKGAHTLDEISRECGGLYPVELKEVLDQLVNEGSIIGIDGLYYAERHRNLIDYPEPHPDDFDWRFDSRTINKLAALVRNESYVNNTALLLGTPSVFVELAHGYHSVNSFLIDGNAELIRFLTNKPLPKAFTAYYHDIRSGLLFELPKQVDVSLCDPPWYTEYYKAFLAQATYSTRLGGSILFCLLPMNTRPYAVEDRRKIIHIAHQFGLHIYSLEQEKVGYVTPPFESKSLRSQGLLVSDNWRRGDLMCFRKVKNVPHDLLRKTAVEAATEISVTGWDEFLLGRYKIKIRGPYEDYDDNPMISSFIPGDTLPTVSRRFVARKEIDLWLWDNRVYKLSGKVFYYCALCRLSKKDPGDRVKDFDHNNKIGKAERDLIDLCGHVDAT